MEQMFLIIFQEKLNVNMHKRISALALLIFSFFHSFSQDLTFVDSTKQNSVFIDSCKNVRIYGTAQDYANKSIAYYKFIDYFNYSEEVIDSFYIDSAGNFDFCFEMENTQEIFMHLGKYKAFIFVEPQKSYNVAFPPYTEKTLADDLNPYYQQEELSLGVITKDSTELNRVIHKFNNMYESFVGDNFTLIYVSRDKRMIQNFESKVDSAFSHVTNPYFVNYKNYRIYSLRFMAYQRSRIGVTKNYLLNKTPQYYNPMYMKFFTMVWNEYILSNYMKDFGKDMRQSIIYGKSPQMFKERLEEQMALRNDTLKELLLLQSLQDCFKRPDVFPERTVYQTLDSLILITKVSEHKIIAQEIRKKQTKLFTKDIAPNFILYNKDSIPIALNKYKGKYVYLNFCRSENFACIQDYKVMAKMNKKTRRYLQIVTVSQDKDWETFKTFATQNSKQFNWTFAYGGDNPEIANSYLVKGTPSYVLINPEGKIEILYAPTPLDNFQEKFGEIVIQKKKKHVEQEW